MEAREQDPNADTERSQEKLKGFIEQEKSKSQQCWRKTRKFKKPKLHKNLGGNMKTRELTYHGDDGENDIE